MAAPAPRRVEATWDLREPDAQAVQRLVDELGLGRLLATLLVNRKLTDPDEVKRFLVPRLSQLPDPFTMEGMEVAVTRILSAMADGQQICVWGDYDVDGVTSASQVIAFFEAVGHPIRFFVPDRFVDGYGLAEPRIRELAADGVDLLITVDCGVSNAHEVAVAAELGMDVIVVDHHQVPPVLPDAVAVLDPVREDCQYPFKSLAACGVTWMLLVALRARMRERGDFQGGSQPDLRQWLDLTAIGTVADMVPLVGLNRVIVHRGLAQIAISERVGVRALCDVANLEADAITAGKIGFHLGPRINAAGRVANASAGVELLTTADGNYAQETAQKVDTWNVERRGLQQAVFEAACELADQHPDPESRRAVVLAQEGWHPGVLGIVCSKLIERYHRPTVMLTIQDGIAKGSARSISGFRLVEHLRKIDHLLLKYGGHDHAAGMSMRADQVEAFSEALDALAREALEPRHLRPRLSIDAVAALDRVTFDLVDSLARLAPHGMGNREPNLLATAVRVWDRKAVGRDKSHLKMSLDAGGRVLDAIAFGMADKAPEPGDLVDVVYVPEINEFRGERKLQVRVKALRGAA